MNKQLFNKKESHLIRNYVKSIQSNRLINDGTMLALQKNNELLEHQIERMDRQRKIIITFGIIGILIFLGLLFYIKSTNTIYWWIYTYKSLGC